MALNAVDSIDDALDRAKDVIFPFDFWDWTRLALISVFLGGAGFFDIFSNIPTGSPESVPSSSGALTGMATAEPSAATAGVAVLAGAVVLAVLFVGYLGSVFEFVMLRSIRERKPSVRDNFRNHMVDGLKYYSFQIVYLLILISLVLAGAAAFLDSLTTGFLSLLLIVPSFILLAVFSGIIHDFALQEVIVTEKGFIGSIKSSFNTVTADWKEFAGYIGFRLVVSIAVGIISSITAITATFILAIPLLIIILIFGLILEPLAVITGLIGILAWLIMMLYITVPFKTYIYSYYVELYNSFMEIEV